MKGTRNREKGMSILRAMQSLTPWHVCGDVRANAGNILVLIPEKTLKVSLNCCHISSVFRKVTFTHLSWNKWKYIKLIAYFTYFLCRQFSPIVSPKVFEINFKKRPHASNFVSENKVSNQWKERKWRISFESTKLLATIVLTNI